MNVRSHRFWAVCAAVLAVAAVGRGAEFWDDEEEDREEYAGAVATFLSNPADGIWGLSAGWGVWIKNTPVFGDYFASLFYNGLEDSTYAGIGMTVRLMPHWSVAPFVGAGGSYNPSLNGKSGDDEAAPAAGEGGAGGILGDSYWAGHVEAGLRVGHSKWRSFFEASGRYTWTTSDGDDPAYWLIGLTWGNRL
jgi:hypothetical protein